MLIAVLSDSHDRTDHLEQALILIKERGISRGLHLGDYVAPFVINQLAESEIRWQGVWGNNDGDKLAGLRMAAGKVDISEGDFLELEIEGRKLFLTHYPQIGRIAALSGQYDAVFYGHTHIAKQEHVEVTLLANPGEIYGMRTGKVSFGIYNTERNSFEEVVIAS